jgi:hypothetical protein
MGRSTTLSAVHRWARNVHKVNSALYGAQVMASGNPKRLIRWGARKLAYKGLAKLFNRL